jgi:hypothetical protein
MVRSQPAEAFLAELRELVEERRSENGTPGVAYGVVGDGAAFAAGSGWLKRVSSASTSP